MDSLGTADAVRETNADIIVAALPMDEQHATAFGLMKIDEEGRIIEFTEKPKGEQPKAMKKAMKMMPFIASMGIYVISKNTMLKLLCEKFLEANDFGSEVIPGATNIGMRHSSGINSSDQMVMMPSQFDGFHFLVTINAFIQICGA
ncbi:small subunit of ADPglucose pyrophosphorylase [Canna indica]|uniref:glucose-1-phosphate adenylyltransferase n=1 Tax=Canna indica TaxID=4628 RepID=A0AAQ3JNW6_9LILI|nr:small subunit of ADPglucose pyrophosphorylase [Canna indica]